MKTRTLLTFAAVLAASAATAAETLRAFQSDSSVDIWIGDHFFTSYRYNTGEKLPYFFPVNGPSDVSVTSVRNPQYPHHASLWFGCDRVNGGNYWQNEMGGGRIITESLVLEGAKRGTSADLPNMAGAEVVINQTCIWRRPNAPEPFRDTRRYVITAPSAALRIVDVTITLEALIDVEIEKTNHSFFSLRANPVFAVSAGGTMVNAEGVKGEKDTFGKGSPWMAFYGKNGTGAEEGIALFQHPANPWYPAPWFTRDYGFLSPTPMYWPQDEKSTKIKQGETLVLRYRTVVFSGDPEGAKIGELFDAYAK
jgi:hypothetical protein